MTLLVGMFEYRTDSDDGEMLQVDQNLYIGFETTLQPSS